MKKMMKLSLVAAMALIGSTGVSSAGIFDWGGHDAYQVDGWSDSRGYGMSSGDVWAALNRGGGWFGPRTHPSVNPHAVSANAGDAGDYGFDGLNRSEDRLAAAASDIYDDAVRHSQTVSFDAPGGGGTIHNGGGSDSGEISYQTDGTNYTHADGTVDQTPRTGESYNSGPSFEGGGNGPNGATAADTMNGY